MKSNGRFVARFSILSFLLSSEDELTHIASCVEKNRLAALWGGQGRKCAFSHFFDSWVTDGRTNGRTDKASYRVACPQLKSKRMRREICKEKGGRRREGKEGGGY